MRSRIHNIPSRFEAVYNASARDVQRANMVGVGIILQQIVRLLMVTIISPQTKKSTHGKECSFLCQLKQAVSATRIYE
jgi:hypothetical protein